MTVATPRRMDNCVAHSIVQGMNVKTDVICVGGGLNGPVTALALAKAGMHVTVLDAQPASTETPRAFDGRAYALSLASKRLLAAIGVWDAVAADAQPMWDIKVTDGHAGKGPAPWIMHFDRNDLEDGPMGVMVEDRHLRAALANCMAANGNIEVLSNAEVTEQSITPSGARVTLASGQDFTAALLIGCDGRSSGTARRAGIGRTGWAYDQSGIVCAVAHEKPHDGIAHQFFMPGGPLAILPLTGNRCSIVWSEQADRAHALMALPQDQFLEALQPAFGSFLGPLELIGDRNAFPLGLSIANSFVTDRIALVGDAAHGIHPIAGQGLNAGLRDVAALRDVLVSARSRGEDIGAATTLSRYQSWRQFDVNKLALATDMFNRLFSNDNPLLRGLRDFGMGAINATPALRKRFVLEAAGLSGDVPSLMQR